MASERKPRFYADGRVVKCRAEFSADGTSGKMGFIVCEANEFVDGAAEEIASALNKLPAAQALLVRAAAYLRSLGGSHPGAPHFGVDRLADEIEEWMVNG